MDEVKWENNLNTGRYTKFMNLLSTLFWFRILLRKFKSFAPFLTDMSVTFLNLTIVSVLFYITNHEKCSKTPEQKQTRQWVHELGVPTSVNFWSQLLALTIYSVTICCWEYWRKSINSAQRRRGNTLLSWHPEWTDFHNCEPETLRPRPHSWTMVGN